MFRRGGYLYVYFTYGMHFCANVVTGSEGKAFAVLLRAVEPIHGIKLMARRRFGKKETGKGKIGPAFVVDLCNGPAKLCEAFGIGRRENGRDLCGRTVWIAEDQDRTGQPTILRSRRIGLSKGRNPLWRFFISENQFVSRGKPSEPESSS